MQATTLAPRPTCCCPIPNHFRFQSQNHRPKRRLTAFLPSQNQTHFLETPLLNLSTTNCCSIKQEKNKKSENQSCSNPKSAPSKELYTYTDDTSQIRTTQNQKQGNKEELQRENNRVIFTNMWWADLKAALGQRINVEGIVSSVLVFTRDRHLAVPHVVVPDIRYIDWAELHRRGFKGVVLDKDNTLTAPYSLTLWGPLRSSLEQCKSLFGSNIAVFSNSAGLYEYDHDGLKARTLEKAIGIKVLRHRVKKPAGTAEEIEEHFGCESSKLIMVGDRPFIDIVYGNRNGFLTILTEPFALTEEPFIVTQVRKLETSLLNQWCRRGLKPVSHNLLPDVQQCVKDSTSL